MNGKIDDNGGRETLPTSSGTDMGKVFLMSWQSVYPAYHAVGSFLEVAIGTIYGLVDHVSCEADYDTCNRSLMNEEATAAGKFGDVLPSQSGGVDRSRTGKMRMSCAWTEASAFKHDRPVSADELLIQARFTKACGSEQKSDSALASQHFDSFWGAAQTLPLIRCKVILADIPCG